MVAHTRAKTPTAAAEVLVHAMLARLEMLEGTMRGIVGAAQERMSAAYNRLQAAVQKLPVATALFMQGQHHRLDLWQKYIDAASPAHILALGYSITRVNGKAVRSPGDIKCGDEVVTTVAGGEFTSTVKNK
jgi:exodeoxyribonuclease VII large subunit